LLHAKRLLGPTPSASAGDRTWLLSLLGHAYLQRRAEGDRERSKRALLEATSSDDVPVEAFFWLGESLSGRQTAEAVAAYTTYLSRKPAGKYADRARRALGPLL
jgi:hypothetical protein